MSDETLHRLAIEIDLEELGEMTSLELQKLMYSAGIGLHRATIERYMKEAYFASVLLPAAWKTSKGAKGIDKSSMMNVSRWKRGPRFDEILGNGHKEVVQGDGSANP